MLKRLALVLLLCSSFVVAADPVAILTAGADVKVNGKPLQTAGAPNWPLAAGDEVVTGSAAAVLSFPDGTRVTLTPNTKAVIQQCDRCVVQLFQGSADYAKAAGSKFEMCALGHPIKPAADTTGSVLIQNKDQVILRVAGVDRVITSGECSCNAGAAWVHPKHTKLIILGIVGGAAAAATTVAITASSTASGQ